LPIERTHRNNDCAANTFCLRDWPELWRYRDLFLVFAWRDISVRYKQTVLGVLWAIIQPVTTMVIFTFIFNRMAKIPERRRHSVPDLSLRGHAVLAVFFRHAHYTSNSMVSNAALIQKVYFPRLIIPRRPGRNRIG